MMGGGQGEGDLFFMPVNLTQSAKELRKNSTEAEKLLWFHLKSKQLDGLKFRRQEQIGPFIVDFVCYESKIVVEADGSQHLQNQSRDLARTEWLNSQGFDVLRFWNNEILTNTEGVLEEIRCRCSTPLPDPLPHGERGIRERKNI